MNAIDAMIRRADLKCTVCDTPMSIGCDCWTKCRALGCTWSYRKGEFCPNCNRAKAETLSSYDREILESLGDDGGGLTTRDVGMGVTFFGSNRRQHSGAVRAWLMNLKRLGLVEFLDDQRPVCWKRTDAGTHALWCLMSRTTSPDREGVK